MLTFAIVSLLPGCATRGVEPMWDPEYLTFYSEDSECIFTNGTTKVPCGSVKLFNYGLIPLDKFTELDAKFDRCESWR